MQLHKLYTAITLPPWLIRPYLPPGVHQSSNLAPNHPGGTPVATRQRPRPAPRHGHADRSLGRVQDDYTALVAYRSRENVPMSFSETFLIKSRYSVPSKTIKHYAVNVLRIMTRHINNQGCSLVFSCGALSPHNLGQKRSKIHLSQKMCQIRREIVKLKDYDGTLSSFYRFSPHNPFCEPTPLLTTLQRHTL